MLGSRGFDVSKTTNSGNYLSEMKKHQTLGHMMTPNDFRVDGTQASNMIDYMKASNALKGHHPSSVPSMNVLNRLTDSSPQQPGNLTNQESSAPPPGFSVKKVDEQQHQQHAFASSASNGPSNRATNVPLYLRRGTISEQQSSSRANESGVSYTNSAAVKTAKLSNGIDEAGSRSRVDVFKNQPEHGNKNVNFNGLLNSNYNFGQNNLTNDNKSHNMHMNNIEGSSNIHQQRPNASIAFNPAMNKQQTNLNFSNMCWNTAPKNPTNNPTLEQQHQGSNNPGSGFLFGGFTGSLGSNEARQRNHSSDDKTYASVLRAVNKNYSE